MVALGPRGGHDGGVRDGGAVVAADGAGHAGGDADDGQGVVHGEHVLHDGDEDAEGAPAGAGGEGQQAADDKDDDGQEHLQVLGAAYKVTDKVLGAQGVGHALQSPGESEDEDGGHHGLEALRDAAHHLLEAQGAAGKVVHQGEQKTEGGAQHQAHGGVGVGEGVHKAGAGEEVAGVDHAHHAAEDQHHDGQHQVDDLALVLHDLLVHHGVGVGAGEQVALLHGVALKAGHGAEVHLHEHQAQHHHDGEQGVEVVRDGPDEEVQALALLGEAGHGGGPGGDGGDGAHRGGGGVDDVGQLGPGDVVLVGDGPHDAAHGEAVEVVVDKDEAAQHNGGQLGPRPGLDVLLGPPAEGGGGAGLVHEAHHGAQDDQEDEDAHVVGVGQGGDDASAEHVVKRPLKGQVGVQQAAHQDADEQGGVHLLGDQGQGDGDDRGQQGQGGVVEVAGGLHIADAAAGLAGDRLARVVEDDTQSAAVGALDHFGAGGLGGVFGEGGGGQSQQQHHSQDKACRPGSSRSHLYDHTFPLRSKAPKGMKPSTSNAASQNLLECV